jgi:NADP-dependent 3-hydroxy acid dehydrogenase YdfG
VHVVCNNAGVTSGADPWFGPLSAWSWVLGVNLWGVIHGVRAFLPILINPGEGHIVNSASIAGLNPGAGPTYAPSKHAVVALSEELFKTTKIVGLRDKKVRAVEIIDEIPKAPSGKTLRRVLIDRERTATLARQPNLA